MITIIRMEGEEVVMTIPLEILHKLNINIGATMKLCINEGTVIARPAVSEIQKFLLNISAEDRELTGVAVLSAN